MAKAVGKMRGEDSAQAGAAEKRSRVIRMRRASCAASLPDPVQRLSDHLFHKEVPSKASQRQKLLEKKLDDIMSGRPGSGELTRVQSVAEGRPSTPDMVEALYRKERKEVAGQIVGRISKPADLWKREEVSGESDSMTPTRTRSVSSVASFSRASSRESVSSDPCNGEQLVRGVHSLRRLSSEHNAPPDADADGDASPPSVSPVAASARSRQRRGSALMEALIEISRVGSSGKI